MYGIRRSIRSLDRTIIVVLVIEIKGTEVTPREKSAAHIVLCWTRSAVCACMLLSIDAYLIASRIPPGRAVERTSVDDMIRTTTRRLYFSRRYNTSRRNLRGRVIQRTSDDDLL